MRQHTAFGLALALAAICRAGDPATPSVPATASAAVQWIRPAGVPGEKPAWGIAGGIAAGLSPAAGPRGLLRIYTPYLDQPAGVIMNYIAVEPVVAGDRGLSELEWSDADRCMGKRMTSFDRIDVAHVPDADPTPAPGVLARDGDVETLSVDIAIERFANGARPVVRLTFRSDRPHEIMLTTFAAADSKSMESCVLTATMGNYARLRHVRLRDQVVSATELFASDRRNGWDFYPWHAWAADALTHAGDQVTIAATGDLDATPPPDGWHGWRYVGRAAVQRWTTAARPGVRARVNGRSTFWGTHVDIPGGPAFENFELMAPFTAGARFRFSIEPVDGP